MRKTVATWGFILVFAVIVAIALSGCGVRESDRVSYNISKQADNFNVTRRLTVFNMRTDKCIMQMTGKMSIEVDGSDNQLEVIVEDEYGEYKKHFIHLGTHIEYVVEDITSDDVSNYHYTLNFNPDMWLPEIETIY